MGGIHWRHFLDYLVRLFSEYIHLCCDSHLPSPKQFSDFLATKQWFICPRVDDNLFQALSCEPNPVFFPVTYHLPSAIAMLTLKWFGTASITLRPIVLHSVAMAIFGSLIAPFGGFFASAIKRAYNKKDFVCISDWLVSIF
jgi:hypothetical protein